jgi:hypothetical protein
VKSEQLIAQSWQLRPKAWSGESSGILPKKDRPPERSASTGRTSACTEPYETRFTLRVRMEAWRRLFFISEVSINGKAEKGRRNAPLPHWRATPALGTSSCAPGAGSQTLLADPTTGKRGNGEASVYRSFPGSGRPAGAVRGPPRRSSLDKWAFSWKPSAGAGSSKRRTFPPRSVLPLRPVKLGTQLFGHAGGEARLTESRRGGASE